MTLLVLFIGAAAVMWLIASPRLLLRWYLREVQRLDIPFSPADTIVTYPLA